MRWRSPAIRVNHEVTLNLSLMNSATTPPLTPIEEAGKFWRAVGELVIEEVVLVLTESVDAGLKIVPPEGSAQDCLRAPVVGILMDG